MFTCAHARISRTNKNKFIFFVAACGSHRSTHMAVALSAFSAKRKSKQTHGR